MLQAARSGLGSALQGAAAVRIEKGQEATKQAPKPKKPLKVFGGLLARVQQRACSRPAEGVPEAKEAERRSPDRTSASSAPHEDVTPPSKRARIEEEQATGKKPEAPVVETKAPPAVLSAPPAFLSAPKPVAQLDDSCQDFLKVAGVLTSLGGETDTASKALAECLKSIISSAAEPKEAVSAAMILMEPTLCVPAGPLAAAISGAFGIECEASLLGEALAAKALEGRARKVRSEGLQPLKTIEVAKVIADAARTSEAEPEMLVRQLVQLLDSTQVGMEPFFLVRAFQGKLAPSREVVRCAVSRSLVQVGGR